MGISYPLISLLFVTNTAITATTGNHFLKARDSAVHCSQVQEQQFLQTQGNDKVHNTTMIAATIATSNAFDLFKYVERERLCPEFEFSLLKWTRTLPVLHWPTKHSLWPAFKGWDSEECHHGSQDVVEVKLAVLPAPGLYHRLVHLTVLVCNVVPSVDGEQKDSMAELHFQYKALRVGGQRRALTGKGQTHLHSAAVCLELSVQLYSLPLKRKKEDWSLLSWQCEG